MSKNVKNITYKCMFCDKRFNRADLVRHVELDHPDDIPDGFSPLRLVFNYVNKKPITYHGKCTECGKPTPWDENKGRYNRQCGSKACHDSFVKKFEDNMIRTRGVARITSTAEGQKKMLANRKISGEYTMKDGGKKSYCGSYELKALEFMDKIMNISSDDILCPGPILEYQLDGKTHMYITDFYYQPYNLIIEVKDGGDNPNKRNMPEYRAKQIAKEEFIVKYTNYNYLRLTNNNLDQLLAVFLQLKLQLVENTGERVININESVEGVPEHIIEALNDIDEAMATLSYAPMVGFKDSGSLYLKPNNPQNNIFKDEDIIISDDPKFRYGFVIDKDKKLQLELDIDSDASIMYKIATAGRTEAVERFIESYKNREDVSIKSIYENFTRKKLYTLDQIKALESINLEKRNMEQMTAWGSIVEELNSIDKQIVDIGKKVRNDG